MLVPSGAQITFLASIVANQLTGASCSAPSGGITSQNFNLSSDATCVLTKANDAQNAYRLGGGTLMQVVDAERQLSRASRALAEAQAQRFADLVQLYAATAADWRTVKA